MKVTIVSSKTDQSRQGHEILVARTGSLTCPVAMLQRYFTMAELDTKSKQHLFRPLCSTKRGEKLRPSGSLSYTRIQELVLGKLKELGYDSNRFGLHSFRAGGATSAANCPGLPERLFKRHGRWHSKRAKDGYIKDSHSNRLRVSKSLGL